MPRGDPAGDLDGAALVAPLIAADPAGLEPRREYAQFPVEPIGVAMQGAPPANFVPEKSCGRGYSRPMPGPYATAFVMVDYDSQRWWGQGYRTQWQYPGTISGDLPSPLPADLSEHVDVFQPFAGGFPNISRNPPVAFGTQVPDFNPNG